MPECGLGGPQPAAGVLGLDRDYPLLMEKSRAYDFTERLGGCTDPLMAEIDKAMRELWDARAYLRDEPNRV